MTFLSRLASDLTSAPLRRSRGRGVPERPEHAGEPAADGAAVGAAEGRVQRGEGRVVV